MNIKAIITEFAMDYYDSDLPPKEYAQQKNLTMAQLNSVLDTANVLNQPSERVRVKNLIEATIKKFGYTQSEMAKIIDYRQPELCEVMKMKRGLPKKKLILLEKYVVEHKICI